MKTIELVGYGPLDGLRVQVGYIAPPVWQIVFPERLTFVRTERESGGAVVYELVEGKASILFDKKELR